MNIGTYFDTNHDLGISTFQDEQILKWLTELAPTSQ